ncbi:right-handed parallel beta-helix repeat-containing protein [Chitinophaga pinensis]|uniref:Parallel beta-helix repeat protein n=1 Tax=Chitinophaga pinensis (strain ATCC 43595 / DSM 2588 / LMG 13176 / NBRC 15968 / NCIMB 11800 / UQM 2034) TaxID=485918 RepID=A0A979G4W2_CHIPD|nr:right-handed parallel beta-helix repeat-containing protein [Chitinophaga pinensis]ACU60930.1 parallel beta-helix repeat protein [Chitinophaga pinensis DSM 2588]
MKKNRTYLAQALLCASILALSTSCKKEEAIQEKLNADSDLAVTATATGREFTLLPDATGRLAIDNSAGTYKAGDIINLKGTIKVLQISNMSGSASAPIVVRNLAGNTVTIGNPAWNGGAYGVACVFWNCHYIRFGGQSGQSSVIISGSTAAAKASYYDLQLGNKTDNIEVSNLTIQNGGNGIVAKTDPVKGDASTAYPNTTMMNLKIHDVLIKNTTNEAMYIGHTATYWDLTANAPYYGSTSAMTSGHQYVQPVIWRNVKIYNNTCKDIGLDGIQTAAIDQLEVYNNEVTNWALQRDGYHNGGILIGGRTTNTNVHDNWVHDGWGEMLQFYGSGENGATHIINNNLFSKNQGEGLSIRGTANAVVRITNNTIAWTKGNSLRLNGSTGMKTAQIISNNAFIRPINGVTTITVRNYIYAEVGAIFTEGTGSVVNKKFPTVQSAKVDINNYYLPMAGSQMGNAGYRKK